MTGKLRRPALDPDRVEAHLGSLPPHYPQPYRDVVAGRAKRRLGDALGLTDFGVNLVELAPGAMSALRHWHSAEDEFLYVLTGEVVLVTDEGEQILRPGSAAGFPKGKPDGHHVVNRSNEPATFLEVGSRNAADVAAYPDADLKIERRIVFTTKQGEPCE